MVMLEKIKVGIINESKGINKNNVREFKEKMNIMLSGLQSIDIIEPNEYRELCAFIDNIDWEKQINFYNEFVC